MINDKKGFRLIVSIKISMSLLILSLIFYLCVPAVSQTSSVNEDVSSQKYALELLKNMSKNIEDLDQFGYHLDIIDEYDYDGVITMTRTKSDDKRYDGGESLLECGRTGRALILGETGFVRYVTDLISLAPCFWGQV